MNEKVIVTLPKDFKTRESSGLFFAKTKSYEGLRTPAGALLPAGKYCSSEQVIPWEAVNEKFLVPGKDEIAEYEKQEAQKQEAQKQKDQKNQKKA